MVSITTPAYSLIPCNVFSFMSRFYNSGSPKESLNPLVSRKIEKIISEYGNAHFIRLETLREMKKREIIVYISYGEALELLNDPIIDILVLTRVTSDDRGNKTYYLKNLTKGRTLILPEGVYQRDFYRIVIDGNFSKAKESHSPMILKVWERQSWNTPRDATEMRTQSQVVELLDDRGAFAFVQNLEGKTGWVIKSPQLLDFKQHALIIYGDTERQHKLFQLHIPYVLIPHAEGNYLVVGDPAVLGALVEFPAINERMLQALAIEKMIIRNPLVGGQPLFTDTAEIINMLYRYGVAAEASERLAELMKRLEITKPNLVNECRQNKNPVLTQGLVTLIEFIRFREVYIRDKVPDKFLQQLKKMGIPITIQGDSSNDHLFGSSDALSNYRNIENIAQGKSISIFDALKEYMIADYDERHGR